MTQPQPHLENPSEGPLGQRQLDGLALKLETVERVLAHSRAESMGLNEVIIIKKRQLDKAAKDHAAKVEGFRLDEARFKARISELKASQDQTGTAAGLAKAELKEAHKTLRALRAEVADAKGEVRERRAYLNQQEELIQGALSAGNEQLISAQRNIESARLEKERLLREVINLRKDREDAADQADIATDRLGALDSKYQETAVVFKQALDELRGQIKEASSELKRTNLEVEAKSTGLAVREKALQTSEEVNAKHEEDLRARELRFKSNQSIYNI